ncbi:ferredoxin [Rhodococcus sp. NPDC003348]
MRVEVDFGVCESNAVCVGIAPDVFDLGEDDHLTVLRPEVTPDNEQGIREAARQCPRQAITIVD